MWGKTMLAAKIFLRLGHLVKAIDAQTGEMKRTNDLLEDLVTLKKRELATVQRSLHPHALVSEPMPADPSAPATPPALFFTDNADLQELDEAENRAIEAAMRSASGVPLDLAPDSHGLVESRVSEAWLKDHGYLRDDYPFTIPRASSRGE